MLQGNQQKNDVLKILKKFLHPLIYTFYGILHILAETATSVQLYNCVHCTTVKCTQCTAVGDCKNKFRTYRL